MRLDALHVWIIRLRAEGLSHGRIAQEVGSSRRSVDAVVQKLRAAGLALPVRPRGRYPQGIGEKRP